jgi:repressor LexA
MNGPTARQQQILDFIQGKQDSEGLAPSLREIALHFRFSSPNAALAHVQALRAKGLLKSLPGCARSLQVLNPNASKSRFHPRVVSVPIYGSIPAGRPADAAQAEEGSLLIDAEMLGIKTSARTFALKVRGDSMTGKGILDGDIAIIEQGVQPHPGDVVAGLIDGQVTLKTLVVQRGKAYLRAENPRYPRLVPREELEVQGVMVGLVRSGKK